MGRVIEFPNRPECPPHDWVPIYDEDRSLPDDEIEFIAGRVCVKCSLIESKDALALVVGGCGGEGKSILSLEITPTFGSDHSRRDCK